MKKKHRKAPTAPAVPAILEPRITVPAFIIAGILFVWAYFVVKAYFKSINFNPLEVNALEFLFSTQWYPRGKNPVFMLSHFLYISINILTVISAYGFGKKLWGILKFNNADGTVNLEEPLFQIALGYGVIIFLTLIVGFFGLLYASFIWVLVLLGAVLAVNGLVPLWLLIKNNRTKYTEGIYFIPLIILLFTAAINLLGALVPETFYDSLAYNIGLSQNWINHHKIFSDKNMMVSFYPLNFTVLYTSGILLKDEIVAKLMALTFMTGTLLSVYLFCKKYFSTSAGIIAGLLFYTVPIVMNIGCKTSIEPVLSFYEFLALFSIINWCSDGKIKWLYLGSILSGIALGGKYTSFIALLSVSAVIFIKTLWFDKERWFLAIKRSVMFAVIAFLIASVWYVKNFILTGDPFYPIFLKFNNQLYGNDPSPVVLTLSNILLFPWKYTMGVLQQETILGPLFLLLIPLLFLYKTLNRSIKFIVIYFSVFFILWFFIGKAYLRFFVPGLAALSIILSCHVMILPSKYGIKKLMILFISVLCFANVLFSAIILKSNIDPWGYFLGMQSKSEYLSRQRPSFPNVYYGAADWINNNTKETSNIFILGECRGYYLKRRFLGHLANEPDPFVRYVKSSSNDDELYEKIKADGFTHILLNVPEAVRLSQYDIFQWDRRDLPILNGFWDKHMRVAYSACGDVTFQNGTPGSTVPDFWDNFIKNPLNFVYVYEIVPGSGKPSSDHPYNFLLDPRLHSENRKKAVLQ